MDSWMQQIIWQCSRPGSHLSSETQDSHDGAHAHFIPFVRDVLNEHFAGRWIGSVSPTSVAPLTWPPHGHNVTTPNSFIWSSMNGRLVAHRRTTNKELWKTPFTPLLHKCCDKCHRGRGDASACVSSIKVHEWSHWTCNWTVCCLMYGDFLPSL